MGIRVQPKELEIPTDDPFKNDLLARKESIEILTDIIGSIEGPCVLAVDSGWGTGKTTFLKMWVQHLRNEGFHVVDFNAWETDFTESPFVALSAEITQTLEKRPDGQQAQRLDDLKKATADVVHAMPGPLLRIAASAIPMVGTQIAKELEAKPASHTENAASEYQEAKEAFHSFRSILQDTAKALAESKAGKPLVIVVDELDRCRPSYAIELLEVAKHFFTVDHIVFVLTVDRSQLAHSIKVLYGTEFDSVGYLRRFFDVDFRLPEPDRGAFIDATLASVGINEYIESMEGGANGGASRAVSWLRSIFSKSDLSLRRVAQAIHRLGLALASVVRPEPLFVQTLSVLLIMRILDSDSYYRFIQGEATDEEAVDAFFSNPGVSELLLTNERFPIEALIIGAKQEAIREEIDTWKFRVGSSPLRQGLPLYQRYLKLTETGGDSEESRHAQNVVSHLRSFNRWIYTPVADSEWKDVGFRHAVNRLELLSHEMRDEEEQLET